MSQRKHLLEPHSLEHTQDVTVLTPRDTTIHSNLRQGSPGVLRASAWIMFLHPLPPKPRWPLTCLHRLKMWCWNMCWLKQRLCRGVTNVSMMKVRTLMLYYLCCIGKQVWWMSSRDRRTFLPVSTCLGRGRGGNLFSRWGRGCQAIQSEDVCWLTGWKWWVDMARFGPGRFLSDTAREDGQERVENKMGRSAQDRQVSPDVLWVNSFRVMLPSVQTTTETSVKQSWIPLNASDVTGLILGNPVVLIFCSADLCPGCNARKQDNKWWQ